MPPTIFTYQPPQFSYIAVEMNAPVPLNASPMALAYAAARAPAPGHFVLYQVGEFSSTRHSGTMPRSCLPRSASNSPADVRRVRLTSPYAASLLGRLVQSSIGSYGLNVAAMPAAVLAHVVELLAQQMGKIQAPSAASMVADSPDGRSGPAGAHVH